MKAGESNDPRFWFVHAYDVVQPEKLKYTALQGFVFQLSHWLIVKS